MFFFQWFKKNYPYLGLPRGIFSTMVYNYPCGSLQWIFRNFVQFRNRPILHTKQQANHQNDPESDDEEIYEGVTIIRPIKGIDPELISCLESSFCQNYPRSKLQIFVLC